ncbi:MAG: hypothetical protein ACW987_18560 [Candidatus Thorarchaeota archaeon]|jgi:hypothetical protein
MAIAVKESTEIKLNRILKDTRYYATDELSIDMLFTVIRKKREKKWYQFWRFIDTKVGFVISYDSIHLHDTRYQDEILEILTDKEDRLEEEMGIVKIKIS